MDLRRTWKIRRLFVVHLLLLLEMCGGRSGKLAVMARRHRNKGNQWWSVYHACIVTTTTATTNLSKVIWEEGRVAALSHTYAVKSPLVTMPRPKFVPKSTPSCGSIAKPHYLPHPWTRPTYDAKRHPDPICHFPTMHWTDKQTERQTDRPTDRRTHVRTDRQIVHGKV